MISGDRSVLQGKKGAFWYTLEELSQHWERIDIITPRVRTPDAGPRNSVGRMQDGDGARYPLSGVRPNVHFHPSPWPLWRQPRWIARKGKELIDLHRHDVMTTHEYPPFYNGIGAARLARSCGIPYALEIHHIVGYPVASSWSERIGRVLSRVYLAHDAKASTAVRTVNDGVQSTLVRWGIPAEKIQVVPSFYLDADALRPDPSVEKSYDLVFCARLVANKGLRELLDALAGLLGMSLLVIGDGPERATAEARVRASDLRDRVTFAGWLPTQRDVIRAIQSAHVFVMNSKSEGGPRVALEAMAAGVPVVATRVGVMPDVIRDGENGVLMDVGQDLRPVLCSILTDDQKRERMGREAQKIIERFERKRLIGEYAAFLQSLRIFEP